MITAYPKELLHKMQQLFCIIFYTKNQLKTIQKIEHNGLCDDFLSIVLLVISIIAYVYFSLPIAKKSDLYYNKRSNA